MSLSKIAWESHRKQTKSIARPQNWPLNSSGDTNPDRAEHSGGHQQFVWVIFLGGYEEMRERHICIIGLVNYLAEQQLKVMEAVKIVGECGQLGRIVEEKI